MKPGERIVTIDQQDSIDKIARRMSQAEVIVRLLCLRENSPLAEAMRGVGQMLNDAVEEMDAVRSAWRAS